MNLLPQTPEYLNTKHYIYSSSSPSKPQVMKFDDKNSVRNLIHINTTRPLKVIVHGFKSRLNAPWMQMLKNAILRRDPEANVYLVGWSKGAAFPFYFQSVANVRVVAAEIKLILDQFALEGLSMKDVHIIGHSVGAHIAGQVGHLTKGQIGRITGLDPASPGFDGYSPDVKLDPSDADYVDVIHTDAVENQYNMYKRLACGGLGTFRPSGHLDIYVNGGGDQPGCGNILKTAACHVTKRIFKRGVLEMSCSHKLATQLFIESVESDCPFQVYTCENYEKYLTGDCLTCPPEGCNVLGYKSVKSKELGKAYVQTFDGSPYCGYSYGVSFQPLLSSYGSVEVSLSGTYNSTPMLDLAQKVQMSSKARVRAVLLSHVQTGQLTNVTLRYQKTSWSWFWDRHALDLENVVVRNGNENQTSRNCFTNIRLRRKSTSTEPLFTDDGDCPDSIQ